MYIVCQAIYFADDSSDVMIVDVVRTVREAEAVLRRVRNGAGHWFIDKV